MAKIVSGKHLFLTLFDAIEQRHIDPAMLKAINNYYSPNQVVDLLPRWLKYINRMVGESEFMREDVVYICINIMEYLRQENHEHQARDFALALADRLLR